MWRLLTLVVPLVACSGDEPTGRGAFLSACETSSDCATTLRCDCGFCTRSCDGATSCEALGTGIECATPSTGCATGPICAETCGAGGPCSAGLRCVDGVCIGAPDRDAGSDAGPSDAGPSDAASPDAAMPVACAPSRWFCAGRDAQYCNAAGDGIVRTVRCGTEGCEDGICVPLRGYGSACGVLRNGLLREELTGETACGRWFPGAAFDYAISVARGDELVVDAEAISPLVYVELTITHACEPGALALCTTTDQSAPGGTVVVRYAPDEDQAVRVTARLVRASGDPTDVAGARIAVSMELVPPPAPPPPPAMICTPGASECVGESAVRYCSADGRFEHEHACVGREEIVVEPDFCSDGACGIQMADSCSDALLVERPPEDEILVSAALYPVHNDVDPGSECFGAGMSGPDRVLRLDLTAGERFTATLNRQLRTQYMHGLYLLSDCAAPRTSCIVGSAAYRYLSTTNAYVDATLSYSAPADQTVYLVIDRELGPQPRDDAADTNVQYVTIRWDGTCFDGVENGDETGVDCGGSCLVGCSDGTPCTEDRECESRRCESRVCTRPAGCGDALFGAGEECDDGNTVDDDFCSNACLRAACDDGLRNGDETSADAGGHCDEPPRDSCESAEFLVLGDDGLGNLTSAYYWPVALDGASDDIAPTCAPSGGNPDHAYSFALQERAEVRLSGFATRDGAPDSRPITVTIARGCGPELHCATASSTSGAGIRTVLDPGFYTAWVDTADVPGDDYELSIDGSLR